jgi:hypothetical protein
MPPEVARIPDVIAIEPWAKVTLHDERAESDRGKCGLGGDHQQHPA